VIRRRGECALFECASVHRGRRERAGDGTPCSRELDAAKAGRRLKRRFRRADDNGRPQPGSARVLAVVVIFTFIVVPYLILLTPVYVIAQRHGHERPWMAFVPFLGLWIVLLEVMERNGWLWLLVLIPYVGWLVLFLWSAVGVPRRHGRSWAWTVAFIVPVANILAFWAYAFTLPEERRNRLAFAA
jgi:hypothetical protein